MSVQEIQVELFPLSYRRYDDIREVRANDVVGEYALEKTNLFLI